MSEVYPCQQCRKRVNTEKPNEQYVIPNKATARSKEQWVYSHYRCWARAGKPDAPPDMADGAKVLRGMLMDSSDATLRALGLQRIPGGPDTTTKAPENPGERGGDHGTTR